MNEKPPLGGFPSLLYLQYEGEEVGDEKTDTLRFKRGVRAQCAQIKLYIHLHKYKLRGFVTFTHHRFGNYCDEKNAGMVRNLFFQLE